MDKLKWNQNSSVQIVLDINSIQYYFAYFIAKKIIRFMKSTLILSILNDNASNHYQSFCHSNDVKLFKYKKHFINEASKLI